MASNYIGSKDVKKEHYELGVLLTEEKKKEILGEAFLRRVGYEMNLDAPKTFNEKIMWTKLYYQNPLITVCSDKFAVKDYVKETIGEGYYVPTIASWDDPDDIDFDALPDSFVLKVNWSSGYNIIVKDKSELDYDDTRRTLKMWMKPDRNSYYQFFNWGFKHAKPVVYAEEYLEQIDGQVYDYKFFTFNGEVKALFIATDRSSNDVTFDFFDRDFNYLPFTYGNTRHANPLPPKPRNYDKMVELAEKLAKPFPFVRVDFYEVGDKIYLGEMTFYSGGGLLPFEPVEWDYKFGEWFILPEKMITDKPLRFESARIACAKANRKTKAALTEFRRNFIRHDAYSKKHYITLFNVIRFPVYFQNFNGYRYAGINGIQLRTRKLIKTNKKDAYLPAPEFDVLPPRMAYMMEEKITMDMKKHYCEQKGYKQLKYFPNLDNPQSYNEKLLWLALHYKHPDHKIASDKALAKDWIGERVGYKHVVPLIGAYDNVNDIDFDSLPQRFVVKANEGWGANEVILVQDKRKIDIDQLKAVISTWLYPWSSYYYNNMCITDEKPEKPLIVIEEFLEIGDNQYLDDYKFYCCNGKVKFSMIVKERGSKNQSRTFVDRDWNVLPFRRAGKFSSTAPEKPANLEKMYEMAETLCKDFPFVRIDFYNQDGEIFVGEMTFTPGLFLRFEPKAWDFKLGEMLDISYLMDQAENN